MDRWIGVGSHEGMKFRAASRAGKKGSRLIGGTRGVAFEFSEKKKALAEGGWSWLVCTPALRPTTHTHIQTHVGTALAISLSYCIKKVT